MRQIAGYRPTIMESGTRATSTSQAWNTSYYRTHGVPAAVPRRQRQRRGEEEEEKQGTERGNTRGGYIARVCPPTYEVNIVTIIIGTALNVAPFSLSLSLLSSFSSTLFTMGHDIIPRYTTPSPCFVDRLERERKEIGRRGEGKRRRNGGSYKFSRPFHSRSLYFLYPQAKPIHDHRYYIHERVLVRTM